MAFFRVDDERKSLHLESKKWLFIKVAAIVEVSSHSLHGTECVRCFSCIEYAVLNNKEKKSPAAYFAFLSLENQVCAFIAARRLRDS